MEPTKEYCKQSEDGKHSPDKRVVNWDNGQKSILTYCTGCGFILDDVHLEETF